MSHLCRWIPGNDTLNCGNVYSGYNPLSNMNEVHCLDQDGSRRSGFWQQVKGFEWTDPSIQPGLTDWQKLQTPHEHIVPVNETDNMSRWETVIEPDWISRDSQRFAGIWQEPPDADFLFLTPTAVERDQ